MTTVYPRPIAAAGLEPYDRFDARFLPLRLDDLQPGVADWIGRVIHWQVCWIIEREPYEGLFACGPFPKREAQGRWTAGDLPPFAWVPECDLADIVPEER